MVFGLFCGGFGVNRVFLWEKGAEAGGMGAMPLSELFQILFSRLILKTSIVELGNHEMIPFGNKIMEN